MWWENSNIMSQSVNSLILRKFHVCTRSTPFYTQTIVFCCLVRTVLNAKTIITYFGREIFTLAANAPFKDCVPYTKKTKLIMFEKMHNFNS